jgi:hypothetical protein
VRGYETLAKRIRDNAKGEALLTALHRAFQELERLGAPRKALIFTESRRTQDYLLSLLAETDYGHGIVLFNGSNNGPDAQRIYRDWLKRHAGSDRLPTSPWPPSPERSQARRAHRRAQLSHLPHRWHRRRRAPVRPRATATVRAGHRARAAAAASATTTTAQTKGAAPNAPRRMTGVDGVMIKAELTTNPGDLVLDSFAGSRTTGAVAHKMGRRWIMIERGEHCHTHIIPRMKKVIAGDDTSGITDAAGWKGGGGFRYYRLAPSLLEQDRWGNWVINRAYNAAMLAEALCKLEGFTYAPSETLWWQHGHSTERDFIWVTTQNLSAEQLQALADEVGEGRSLLVLCSAFRGLSAEAAAERWPNLTLKKIPRVVLARCEWGRDDYSLNVQNLPMAERDREPASDQPRQGSLFDEQEP